MCSQWERGLVSLYCRHKYENDDKCEKYDEECDYMEDTGSDSSGEGEIEDWESEDGDTDNVTDEDSNGHNGDMDGDNGEDNGRDESEDNGENNPEAEGCPTCFLPECIILRHQLWMPTVNYPPSPNNHSVRKELYTRFWGLLSNKKAFQLRPYVQKKMNSLRQLPPHLRRRRRLRREILPDCVVRRVRQWYPNEGNTAYMGHYWYSPITY